MTDEKLLEKMREATRGLTFMSESDYPFEVFKWDAKEPTPEFMRGLTKEAADAPVETTTLSNFFRVAASDAEWKNKELLAAAKKFRALQKLLEENLKDLKVYRVGSVNIPVYIVGRAPSGRWLGVSTRVVET